jgi:hypothetical protein
MANVLATGAPTVIAASRRSVTRGWMPPLVSQHYRLGESLLHVDAHLGLLICHDVDFCLLTGIGPRLLHIWWSLSCKASSLPGRGS